MQHNNYIFTSERLGFRQWQDSDVPRFVAMNQDARVMKFFPNLLPENETCEMVERMKALIDQRGYSWFAVDELSSGHFIGFIGLNHPRFESFFTPCLEIGWRLHPDFWHKGYATEGGSACLDFAFNTLKVEKVYAFTADTNQPSEQVMVRLGMTKVGEFLHPLLPNHPLSNHVLYVTSGRVVTNS